MHAKFQIYWFLWLLLIRLFNSECHNVPFLVGYSPPQSSTKLCDISAGRNDDVHWVVIYHIHHFSMSKIYLIPFLIANLWQKSMGTSLINRCEPSYVGTEFANRDIVMPHLTVSIQSGKSTANHMMKPTSCALAHIKSKTNLMKTEPSIG